MENNRIKLARKKAGYSLRDLAQAIDNKVSAQAIGKYERGEMTPSSDVLIALSDALDVSIFYLIDIQRAKSISIDFRAKAGITRKELSVLEVEVIEWVEQYFQIEQTLALNKINWNKNPLQLHKIYSIEESENLAIYVREVWKLGFDPIPNMTELFEENDLKILITDLPQKISALTCLVKKQGDLADCSVIVVNVKCSLEVRRLALAHELYHYLVVQRDGSRIDSNLSQKNREKAANQFARAFLMPSFHLKKKVGNRRHCLAYQELISLKQIYRVSGAALLVRLRDLGIISSSTLTYMFQSVARTWRTNEPEEVEPLDKRGEYEQPQRFEMLCYLALSEDLISLSLAAELLCIRVEKVEDRLKGPKRNDF